VVRDEQQWQRQQGQGPTSSDKFQNKILLVFDSAFSLDDFGILVGVLSGLKSASSLYFPIIGCDMPFVNKYVARFLFEIAEYGNYDAVVQVWENRMIEPLHTIYKKEYVLAAVKRGDKQMFTILSRLKKVNYIQVDRLREFDTELMTFWNI